MSGQSCVSLRPVCPQVLNGAILQQVFVVEFVIQAQMCDDCHRVEAKDFWKAVVQVRQKVSDVSISSQTDGMGLFEPVRTFQDMTR